MNRLLICLLASVLTWPLAAFATANAKKPNILLLVADDLGFSDLSALGSEIATPNLDRLLRQGRLLLDFHSAPACSPTRAMLMSGNDPHLAGLGMMSEARSRLPEGSEVHPGYEGVLGDNVATLAELLRDAGYRTYIAGKWHLGGAPEQQPHRRGFDQAYVLLEGGSAHFKQANMGLMPNYPWTFVHNGQALELPDDFYSSTWFTERLMAMIGSAEDRPFFALAAYTSPHWPLQAPDAYLEQQRGRYDRGYEVLAEERLARQRQLGMVAADYRPRPLLEGVPAWNALSPEEQQRSARSMEVYAAMVRSLDDQIGRLVDFLRQRGELDNTLIVFMSDNGPESLVRGDPAWVAEHFDNRLENYGRRDSFLSTGPAWAQVSALPNRRYKMTPYEGGIRVPAFVHFPRRFSEGSSDQFASVRDVLPTLVELAGASLPGVSYRGRSVIVPQGTSLLAHLEGRDALVHSPGATQGWAMLGSAAMRRDRLKLLFDLKHKAPGWRLYDLARDPGERHDLAAQHPQLVAQLLRDWRAYAQRNNIVLQANGQPLFPAVQAPAVVAGP
ncbi:sulfatase-like hydrolase/transferase [Pseudomonas sp. NFXW11]|uniref:arylsulfatase n=1 Tax=Pseudomonas sp. NFXW11 TaxID=2819531 RepID=UPI003CE9F901